MERPNKIRRTDKKISTSSAAVPKRTIPASSSSNNHCPPMSFASLLASPIRLDESLDETPTPVVPCRQSPSQRRPLQRQQRVNRDRASKISSISLDLPNLTTIGYNVVSLLGKGAYGNVYLATKLNSGEHVAVKRCLENETNRTQGVPADFVREISTLRSMMHKNIVKVLDVRHTGEVINVILEYCDYDLDKLQRSLGKNNFFTLDFVRSLMLQMALGLNSMHRDLIAHRDLKPQNILIRPDGVLKIADMGLSRSMQTPVRPYSVEIVTVHYRPPELFLNARAYSWYIDMWSVGCILVELIQKRVLFPFSSEIDMLRHILRIIPAPPITDWPDPASVDQLYRMARHPSVSRYRKRLRDHVPRADAVCLDLIENLLKLVPFTRMTSDQMAEHQFVKGAELIPIEFDRIKEYIPDMVDEKQDPLPTPMHRSRRM